MKRERMIKFVGCEENLHPQIEADCYDFIGGKMLESVFLEDVKFCIYPSGLIVQNEEGKRFVVRKQHLEQLNATERL